MTTVSIIIPALDEISLIAASVERAWRLAPREVIVADGGSADGTAAAARRAGACVVESRRGRALQQNAGAAAATSDILLFLHADTWLEPAAGEQIVRAAKRHAQPGAPRRAFFGAFRQKIEADGLAYRLLECGNDARSAWLGRPYGDQGLFVRRSDFERIGGFPQVPLMEDLLLVRRLRREAWPVILRGPIHTSARRWQRYGIVRQTLTNWTLLAAAACGVSHERLAQWYERPPNAAAARR